MIMKKIKIFIAAALLSVFTPLSFSQQDAPGLSNEQKFQDFNDKVRSYENALVLVVQTFDAQTKIQSVDNVSVSVVKEGQKAAVQKVKTPYYYVIADYKEFKDKYDFATSNEKSRLLKQYADAYYLVSVDADLSSEKVIEVALLEKRRAKADEIGTQFPFHYSTICAAKYSDTLKRDTALENIKDYYTGPRFIKK